jgi:hypothetical protein
MNPVDFEQGPIAEDAEAAEVRRELKIDLFSANLSYLGVLGDRLFASNRMNDRVKTAFGHLTQPPHQAQVIVRVGRGLHSDP